MRYSVAVVALIAATVMTSFSAQGQKRKQKNNQPIVFTEVWIWEYARPGCSAQEMEVYYHPGLRYWLIPGTSLEPYEEMVRWYMLKPDGEVLEAYSDAEYRASNLLASYRYDTTTYSSFNAGWQKGTDRQFVGDSLLWSRTFTATEYVMPTVKTPEHKQIYLADTWVNLAPLYAFNSIDLPCKLPIAFPHGFPSNMVVVKGRTTPVYGDVSYNLKHVGFTQYYVNLHDYRRVR